MLESEMALNMTTPPKSRVVNLLPALGSYLMSYKEHERHLPTDHYDKVFDRSSNATSTILLDGKIVGVWDIKEDKEPSVKILLFNEIKNNALSEICSKAPKIGNSSSVSKFKYRNAAHCFLW